MKIWKIFKMLVNGLRTALRSVAFSEAYDYTVQAITVINYVKAKTKGQTYDLPEGWSDEEKNGRVLAAFIKVAKLLKLIPGTSSPKNWEKAIDTVADKLSNKSKTELIGVWHGMGTGILTHLFPKVDPRIFSFLITVIYASNSGLRNEQ